MRKRSTSRKRSAVRRRSASPNKLKLVKITKSPKKDKKYRAVFIRNGREKSVDFGASGYQHYSMHKDPERKQRYIDRHKSRENWRDPTTAGALSRYILWNKTTLRASISDYKRRFGL
jgi:hypothetical protein